VTLSLATVATTGATAATIVPAAAQARTTQESTQPSASGFHRIDSEQVQQRGVTTTPTSTPVDVKPSQHLARQHKRRYLRQQ